VLSQSKHDLVQTFHSTRAFDSDELELERVSRAWSCILDCFLRCRIARHGAYNDIIKARELESSLLKLLESHSKPAKIAYIHL
jgi:hypothetical protein